MTPTPLRLCTTSSALRCVIISSHLIFIVIQVTEEMRFGTDEAPKARDAVVLQVIVIDKYLQYFTVQWGLSKGRGKIFVFVLASCGIA